MHKESLTAMYMVKYQTTSEFMRYITRILFLALCTDALYLLNQYNYRFFTEAIN